MKLKELHNIIYSFLEKNYENLKDYRNFYGLSFLALSFYKDKKVLDFCINEFNNIDKEQAKNFHWEFNNYAWLTLKDKNIKIYDIPSITNDNIKFRNNNVSNWFFLKHLCLLKLDCNNADVLKDIKNRLKLYQDVD
jgi:hypothetical protein